jgi:hypothetical protein
MRDLAGSAVVDAGGSAGFSVGEGGDGDEGAATGGEPPEHAAAAARRTTRRIR